MSAPVMRLAIGVDPGVASPAGVAVVGELRGRARVYMHRSVSDGTNAERVRRGPVTRLEPLEQLQTAGRVAEEVARSVLAMLEVAEARGRAEGWELARPVLIAVECYEDQGPTRKRADGRYLTPYMLGALTVELERRHHAYLPDVELRGQVASKVLGPRGYRALMQNRRTEWIAGWHELANDHERAAACHALYALRLRNPLELG